MKKLSEPDSSKKAKESAYETYTKDQISAAFDVFDEDRKGKAKVKNLGTILNALGRVLSHKDLEALIPEVEDPDTPGYMRLEKILPMAFNILMQDRFKPSPKEDLLRALSSMDRDRKGYLEPDQIKSLYSEYGESFDDDEVTKFLDAAVNAETTIIFYKDFCRQLVVPQVFDIVANRRKIRKELAEE